MVRSEWAHIYVCMCVIWKECTPQFTWFSESQYAKPLWNFRNAIPLFRKVPYLTLTESAKLHIHVCACTLMGWHISQVIAILYGAYMRHRAIILAHFSVWHCILTTFSTCDLHECKTCGMLRIFRYCFWGSELRRSKTPIWTRINCHCPPRSPFSTPSFMVS